MSCPSCSNSNFRFNSCSPCKSNTSYDCYKPRLVNKRQCTDLAINILALPLSDDLFLYLIIVANNGPITAQNVFINGTFSGSVLFVVPPSAQPGVISLNIGDVPPGPFLVYVGLFFDRSESSFVSATVSSNTPDCYLPNNSAEASDIIDEFIDGFIDGFSGGPSFNVEQNEFLQLAKDNYPGFIQLIKDKYPDLNLS